MMAKTMTKLAFLFPGQNSQYAGMGRDLAEKFPIARETFDEADEALGFSISRLCFEGPEDQLKLTEYQQPAICTVSVAALRVLRERGVEPAWVAGHSLGEYAANVAAGSLAFRDAVRIVRQRGKFMQEAVPPGQGAMAAVLGMSSADTARACDDAAAETQNIVSAANFNSPEQTVISGEAPAVERAGELCKERGAKRVVMLQVSAPFHCALMQPAQDRLAELLRATEFSDARVPVAVNVDAALLTDGGALREALIRQVTGAVRWVESVRLLLAQGPAALVEVGPGKVLTGLMRQIDRGVTCVHVEDGASLEKALQSTELGA
ncbi:MAG: ACP S-malonyltransferase [Acidobacteriaceae bacterium]